MVRLARAGLPQGRWVSNGPVPRDPREHRELHALDDDGMVLCNPRDREAAHRAEVEGIATANRIAVTCKKSLALLRSPGRAPA